MSDFSLSHTKLGDDGRVVIPATMRKELGLRPGDTTAEWLASHRKP
jgi:bifunctional DNA-binding transcriptional regulator/antitoxin component of YhaV-PrlF toxin-antitoxin module